MRRYGFLFRPRWLALHLLAVSAVVVFVLLGFWQLRRWDDRRTHNALVLARQGFAEVELDEALPPVDPQAGAWTSPAVDAGEFRAVRASGTYLPDDQVLVRGQTQGGSPGYAVLTPLRLADGRAVVVNRGWVPFDIGYEAGPVVHQAFAPPTGTVAVTGLLQRTRERAGGPVDPADGRLTTLARADLARVAQQVGYPLVPMRIDLVAQAPAQPGQLPAPVPPPELDEGPHLGYAGQWFIFAGLTVIVYPLFLRRAVRNHRPDRDGPDDADLAAPAMQPTSS